MEYDYSETMTSSDAMALDNDSEMTPGMFFSVIFFIYFTNEYFKDKLHLRMEMTGATGR